MLYEIFYLIIQLTVLQADAKDRFMACKTAYQTLADEKERKKYDQTLSVSMIWSPKCPHPFGAHSYFLVYVSFLQFAFIDFHWIEFLFETIINK